MLRIYMFFLLFKIIVICGVYVTIIWKKKIIIKTLQKYRYYLKKSINNS